MESDAVEICESASVTSSQHLTYSHETVTNTDRHHFHVHR